MLPVNDNTLDLSKYRGTITRCPACKISDNTKDQSKADAVFMERITLGRSCNVCLGHGFVAKCKNCSGTGIYHGSAVAFGGGDVPHHSACNPCGASGYFAVRKPDGWKDDNAAEPVGTQEVVASATATV